MIKFTAKLSVICFTLLSVFNLTGQTIVNTQPENRNVILEEFTGRNCIYCPNGHTLAAQLEEFYSGDVFIIARHTGYFSPTDYPNLNLAESDSIRIFYGANSFPSGVINRDLYQNSGPVLGLDKWQGATASILGQASYVNVGVEASVNPDDRMLNVHTELYYTENASSTNKISIVLVQSGIIGFQLGVGPYYEFNHNPIYHFNGVWGEEIETTTSGTFIDETYSVELPEYFNDIEIDLNNLAVVVFVSEDDETIVSGSGIEVEMSAVYDNDPALTDVLIPLQMCMENLSPVIEVKNAGNAVLTFIDVQYMVNNGEYQEYTWTGSLDFLETTEVELPQITFDIQQNNILEVEIINDENPINNTIQKPFNFAFDVEGEFMIEYKTIFDSDENYWEIENCDGEVILSGDGYNNLSVYEIPVEIQTSGCFEFNFYDTEGNGFASPSAFLKIIKDGEILFEVQGDFGDLVTWSFASDFSVDIEDVLEKNNFITVYPNPAKDIIFIETLKEVNKVQLVNITGQLVLEQIQRGNQFELNTSDFEVGIYFVKVFTSNNVITRKLIIE